MRKRSAALFKAVCVVFSVCTLVLCLLWRVRLAQAEENIAALEDALKEAETEARVLKALRRASEGRTVLSISHRIYEDLGGRTVEIKASDT